MYILKMMWFLKLSLVPSSFYFFKKDVFKDVSETLKFVLSKIITEEEKCGRYSQMLKEHKISLLS